MQNWPLGKDLGVVKVKSLGESAGKLFGDILMINAEYDNKHFFAKICCPIHVFLCALVLRPVCARTHAHLTGNIADDSF